MKNSIQLILILLFAAVLPLSAQSRTNRLYRPCPASATPAKVEIQSDGDIDLIPCSGRSVLINGSSTSGLLTGTGTANYVPRFTSGTAVGNTPFSWDGTDYLFNNTALDSEFTLDLLPSTTVGRFRVGDFTTTATAYFDLNQSSGNVYFQSNAINRLSLLPTSGLSVTAEAISMRSTGIGNLILDSSANASKIGDVNNDVHGTYLDINDLTETYKFNNGNAAGTINLTEITTYQLNRTITAGGTTGNRTINKPAGTVNLAAASGSVTVTNNLVTTSSLIFLTKRTNDATCDIDNVVAAAGSFVITMTANCTAETSVGFLVTN